MRRLYVVICPQCKQICRVRKTPQICAYCGCKMISYKKSGGK